MTDLRLHRRSTAALLAVAAAIAVAFLVAPAGASAARATSCAKEIVDDWYGDGRVDKIYPLHCYREAIRSLGVDLKIYSGAEDDILRALAYAKQGKTDPGDAGTGKPPKGDSGGPQGPGKPGSNPGTDTTDTTDTTGTGVSVDTSGPSSIPLPLILLAGLAVLLLAAGGAGYLNRRAEARRADGPDDTEL